MLLSRCFLTPELLLIRTGDLSRYFGGEIDIPSVQAHSLEFYEEPGELSKIPIDEDLIKPIDRIPRVTSATW